MFISLIALLCGCGLNERERAISDANQAIIDVQEASERVANAIATLPEDELVLDNFGDLNGALADYLDTIDVLNAKLRSLGEMMPELEGYLDTTFRPSAEGAATACQEAIDTFQDEAAETVQWQQAITRIGSCVDSYALAVNAVRAEHLRISG